MQKGKSIAATLRLCAIMFVAVASIAPARAVVPGISDDCLKGGDIVEQNGFGVPMDATTFLTDKDTHEIFGFVDHGIIPAGGSHTVNLPPGTILGHVHCDAFNVFAPVAAGGGGGIGGGALANLKMESLYFD